MPSFYGNGLWGKGLYSQSITATGALAVTQAAQTLVGFGVVVLPGAVDGNLILTQANQRLTAAGTVGQPSIGWVPVPPCPAPPWGEPEPCPLSMWTPVADTSPVDWEPVDG